MKNYHLIILSLVLFLMQAVSLMAQTNLVTNGGFEGEVGENGRPTGWTYNGSGATWSVITSVADIPEGTKALNINVTAAGGTNQSIYQTIGIVAGEAYKFSFSYNVYRESSSTSGGLTYSVQWKDASGTVISTATVTSSLLEYVKDFWLPSEVNVTAPVGAVDAVIYIRGNRKVGIYIDDVQWVLVQDKQSQTISGLAALTKTVGDADFDLSAVASSGLEVSYSITNSQVATVSGNRVHIVGAGTATITATQEGNENYNPAQPVSVLLTVNTPAKQNQSITGLEDITKTLGDAPFDLAAVASSGLAVSYASSNTSVATVSGSRVTLVGAGTTTITASQYGSDSYNPAPAVTAVLTVNPPAKQSQTISGLAALTKTVGDADFDLSAVASSGLSVSYSSSNAAVATVSGSTVHIVGAGETTITASQAGNDSYHPATPVTAVLTVNPAPKQVQSITGLAAITKTVGDADFELSAVASSGLPVSYTSSNAAVATVSGSTVHIVGAGETTITASQAGNDVYNAAPNATATLTVNPAARQPQTITGLAALTKTVGDADFKLSATASSGLAVSYTSSNAAVATIVGGDTVHIVGAGETVITASQAGNDSFEAAPNVTVTLTVSKQSQSITGLAALTKMLSDAPFELSATASSGLTVSYTSSDATVATVSGSTVTLTGAGTTVITASQAGNDSFAAAPNVTATLTVTDNTGIADVKAPLPVRRQGDDLVVGGAAAGSRIDVFTVIGRRQQSAVSAGGDTVLSGLPKGELLIVRNGNAVAKVIIN